MRGKKNVPAIEPSQADYWYAAGFIDGEGCITVRQSSHRGRPDWSPTWYASCEVSQVDPRPLQWMQERWGGSLRPISRKRGNERDAWTWQVVGRQAYRLFEGVLPMLKVKDAQARNALRLTELRLGRGYSYADGQRNRLTAPELAERLAIRDEALRLNRRGQVWAELPEA